MTLKQSTKAESVYMSRVKALPCGLCGARPPNDAHHILDTGRRISHYLTIPLCHDKCHQGANGRHGDMTIFKIMKVSEFDILAHTIRRLV